MANAVRRSQSISDPRVSVAHQRLSQDLGISFDGPEVLMAEVPQVAAEAAPEIEIPAWAVAAAAATGKTPHEVMVTLGLIPDRPVIPDWAVAAAAATGKTVEEVMGTLAGVAVVPGGGPRRTVVNFAQAPTVAQVPVAAQMATTPRRNAQEAGGWRGSLAVSHGLNPVAQRAPQRAPVRAQSAERIQPTGSGMNRLTQLAQARLAAKSPRRVRGLSELHPEQDSDGMKTRYGGVALQSAINENFHGGLRTENAPPTAKRVVKAPAASGNDHIKFGFDPSRRTIVQDATMGMGFGGAAAVAHSHAHSALGSSGKVRR